VKGGGMISPIIRIALKTQALVLALFAITAHTRRCVKSLCAGVKERGCIA
jgi:hypothetical protein